MGEAAGARCAVGSRFAPMPITFETLLRNVDVDPADVRLLRHQDRLADTGRTPYELWRDEPASFELYQRLQRTTRRSYLQAPYWASFVVTGEGEVLFAGLYAAKFLGLLRADSPRPHRAGVDPAGSCDEYELKLQPSMADLAGRLVVEWRVGARSWIQRADRKEKVVIEIRRTFMEPPFPGFMEFREPLSKIEVLPRAWIEVLRSSRGVYLLTCPKTKEQYVGSATGEECFWQRWIGYAKTGHGGNVRLMNRDPSDYQVSILEVAGSAATLDEIRRMEGRWQAKLRCQEMGLNGNWAGA